MTLNGAIMQLVEMRENGMMPVVFKPYFDKVIETISECVEPSEIPHWIPCSERLPEERQEILATTTDNAWGDVVIIRTYYKEMHKSVIAWMPLPEPYREEGD